MKTPRHPVAQFRAGSCVFALAALLWAGCTSSQQLHCKRGETPPVSSQRQVDRLPSTVNAKVGQLASKVEAPTSEEPIEITLQPADQLVEAGDSATFFVEARPDALTYQWYKVEDGRTNELKGADREILTTGPIPADEAALYQCKVSNAFGCQWTRQASLTVVPKGYRTMSVQAVYGAYRAGAGTKGNCPGNFSGTVTLTAPNGSKWFTSTNPGPISARAAYASTPVRVEITELQRMAVSCGLGSAIFSDGKAKYQYAITCYFGSPAPANGTPILISISWP